MSWHPSTRGLSSYILSVLADEDRNHKFELALRYCVSSFRTEQGYRPHVLDFGCGAGLLTHHALKAGAAFVTAVDCNEDVRSIARLTLERAGFVEGTHFAILDRVPPDAVYDVLVSDILGTLTTSERACQFWTPLERCIKKFDFAPRPYYCVPSKLVQWASVVRFPEMFNADPSGGMKHAFRASCRPQDERVHLVSTQELGLPLCSSVYQRVHPRVQIRVDVLGGRDGTFLHTAAAKSVDLPIEHEDDLLCFEWTATLFDGVTVQTTLEEYASLPPGVRACRATRWGLMLGVPPLGSGRFGVAFRAKDGMVRMTPKRHRVAAT